MEAADDWQRYFTEAVLENDRQKRIEKIGKVEKIINNRLQITHDHAERNNLNDALTALKIMRS